MNQPFARIVSIALGILACAVTTVSSQPAAAPGAFDVRSYGAVGDGKTKCTDAIRQAIAAASEKGGGTIYFPPGIYLTGPIHLRSHITLYVDAGAVIKFSTNFDDYLPMVPTRWEGIEATNFSPLIYAQNAECIAIQGRGTLDGQGMIWWARMEQLEGGKSNADAPRDKYQQEFARLNPHPLVSTNDRAFKTGFLRPQFFQPNHCTNVLVQGVSIINSPFWTVTPVYCDDVTIESVLVQNPISPNTDGINPDSCRNVHIANCQISVGDDCITIKSGRDADGLRVGRPAENYTIVNCTMANGHGGVVIGSETSGGVKNITIANCVFDGTDRGIRIKSARGRGGIIEDVRVNNIVMRHVNYEAVILTTFYESSKPEPVSARTPIFRNIRMSGITGDAQIGISMTGLVEMPLDGIAFNDIRLDATTGISIMDAKNISFRDVTINTAHGPVLTANKTDGLELDGVRTTQAHENTPMIDLRDVKHVFIHGCSAPPGLEESVRILAKSAPEVVLEGNNFGSAKTQTVESTEAK